MSVLKPVRRPKILLLDDLGASKSSPWAMDMVWHIVNVRYIEKRVTLLATNYLDGHASLGRPGRPGARRRPVMRDRSTAADLT
jgi:DNA replication protein DnaC